MTAPELTAEDIFLLPTEQRMQAFIDRWKDLNDRTGCRTSEERDEMATIVDAIVSELIRHWEKTR